MQKRKRHVARGLNRHRSARVPFGNPIASRRYVWVPPVGHERQIDLEIGAPVRVNESEWACPFRITVLPKAIDTAAHGIDAVQALELALVGAGRGLERSPQFRAGQIKLHEAPITNAAALFMPLPMHSVLGAVENVRQYLERQEREERETEGDWFDPEWRRGLLGMMREISGDLATLAAHLPIASRMTRRRRRSRA